MTPRRTVLIEPGGNVKIIRRPQSPGLRWLVPKPSDRVGGLPEGESSDDFDERLLLSHGWAGWWGAQPIRLDVFAEDEPESQTMPPLMLEVIRQLAPDLVSDYPRDLYGPHSDRRYMKGAWR